MDKVTAITKRVLARYGREDLVSEMDKNPLLTSAKALETCVKDLGDNAPASLIMLAFYARQIEIADNLCKVRVSTNPVRVVNVGNHSV